jgi:hypothetical protein
VKTVAGGAVATVVQRNSWVTATATGKRPPTTRGQTLRNLKTRVSSMLYSGVSVETVQLYRPCLLFCTVYSGAESCVRSF